MAAATLKPVTSRPFAFCGGRARSLPQTRAARRARDHPECLPELIVPRLNSRRLVTDDPLHPKRAPPASGEYARRRPALSMPRPTGRLSRKCPYSRRLRFRLIGSARAACDGLPRETRLPLEDAVVRMT